MLDNIHLIKIQNQVPPTGQLFIGNNVSATINAISRTDSTATVQTTTNHSLATGDLVVISGISTAAFNGIYTITATPASNTFSYTTATSGNISLTSASGIARVSIDMHTPAWTIIDLLPLWLGAELRGDDRILPGVSGVIPYRRRNTVTQHSLPMIVIGSRDRLGAAYTDMWVGLESNINYLMNNVVSPTNTGDGTRSATLVMPSGAVRTANIHVLRLSLGTINSGIMKATLDISIPAGVFA